MDSDGLQKRINQYIKPSKAPNNKSNQIGNPVKQVSAQALAGLFGKK